MLVFGTALPVLHPQDCCFLRGGAPAPWPALQPHAQGPSHLGLHLLRRCPPGEAGPASPRPVVTRGTPRRPFGLALGTLGVCAAPSSPPQLCRTPGMPPSPTLPGPRAHRLPSFSPLHPAPLSRTWLGVPAGALGRPSLPPASVLSSAKRVPGPGAAVQAMR